ncbi:hypothetical protein cypCar_00014875 [Cyprinus carpio]|nr:hypothetical protein cypCar_00014875 [Cyprinus carpio]
MAQRHMDGVDNQFRMSILERLEQMERRMAEMSNNSQQSHMIHYHQQLWRNQSSAPRLTPENQSGLWFERRIVAVCERMMAGGCWERGGLSSSSSVPSPSDPPSPSPSSAYSSGSVPDPMDSASSPSSPFSAPPPAGSTDSLFLMDCEAASPSPAAVSLHSELADELLNYSENAENEDFLSDEVLQVDMATLAEQIIEATPERIKQEEFNREAESPLRERRDNPAIHDTMPWLATYLDTVDRSRCPTPPSLLSDLALQRLRPPSSVAWAEFLNASANGRMERDFALLTLTDTEQRELYEAARVIQNAFRRYKGRRLKEQQDMAAAVIQRCYRKYKQYALYKKMTQAAILIQSKFRSYYEQKKFQQSRRAAVLIQQYYRSYKEYERIKQGPRGPGALNTKLKGSFLTKKQDQAARKIMRFLRRCRHSRAVYRSAGLWLFAMRMMRGCWNEGEDSSQSARYPIRSTTQYKSMGIKQGAGATGPSTPSSKARFLYRNRIRLPRNHAFLNAATTGFE